MATSDKNRVDPDATTRAILAHWEHINPDDRIAHLVRDLARGFNRSLQTRLADHGVSFGHWIFLRAMWHRDGVTQRDLAIQVGLTEPTTHTAVTKMVELGYVTRRRREGNLKKQYIFLTKAGRELEQKLVPLAQEVNQIALEGIDEETQKIVRGALLKMIRHLALDEAQALAEGKKIPSTRSLGAGNG
ncbi:MarR family winged helix-turn-helix transcriptional regulator [Sneathiella sp.]|uniref:MarR family winged helix-turn-helix transcriptional regulator n=1 Tax=Sneathiella sp. TaxID=1964365 RepID=UPI002FE32C94